MNGCPAFARSRLGIQSNAGASLHTSPDMGGFGGSGGPVAQRTAQQLGRCEPVSGEMPMHRALGRRVTQLAKGKQVVVSRTRRVRTVSARWGCALSARHLSGCLFCLSRSFLNVRIRQQIRGNEPYGRLKLRVLCQPRHRPTEGHRPGPRRFPPPHVSIPPFRP